MGKTRQSAPYIAFKIAAIYAVIGALWILLSDHFLATLVRDPDLMAQLQTYKGWFYVLVTAGILYLLIRRHIASLRSQFEEIHTIFDALNAIVYVADFETHELLYFNNLAEQLFGPAEGKLCYLTIQSGQTGPCEFCTNDRLVVDGVPQPPYIVEIQNTVNQRWYQCIDKAIRWPDGRLVRLEIAIDITDTKGLEQLKEEMLSSVNHEMRTPLTAILGFIEYLRENDPPTEERRKYLQILYAESLRLNQLIDNFLHLNRIKARRESYRMVPLKPVSLLNILQENFKSMSTRHPLRLEIEENLPDVLGDMDGILLVLDNLVSNAVKYSPPDTEIAAGADRADGEIRLWVRDQGIGLSTEELKRIFGDFYRVDNSDRRRTGGAGLGLALAREIVAMHQGRIWVESTPEKGSTFFFTLPAASTLSSPAPESGN